MISYLNDVLSQKMQSVGYNAYPLTHTHTPHTPIYICVFLSNTEMPTHSHTHTHTHIHTHTHKHICVSLSVTVMKKPI